MCFLGGTSLHRFIVLEMRVVQRCCHLRVEYADACDEN